MIYSQRRQVKSGSQSEPQFAVLEPVWKDETDEVCSICGESMGDSHACLHDVPATLLTLQDPRIGTIFGERYLLEDYAGMGDTCFVYKARDQMLNSYVAAKIPRQAVAFDQISLLRAQRAAQIASRLDHPNIVRVVDLICYSEAGPNLIMEWTGGQPLSEIIARQAPLNTARALSFIGQVVHALIYARQHNVNHIRIKPSTIMVQATSSVERVKVLDFGIMKMLTAKIPSAVTDSSPYRSPEERDGQAPDERSTIFAVGMVLYEMLSEKFDDTVRNTGRAMVPALVKVRPDMKEASQLDDVVFKCTATRPEQRYKSLAALADAIQALMQAQTIENEVIGTEHLQDQLEIEEQALTIELVLVLLIVVALAAAFICFCSAVPSVR